MSTGPTEVYNTYLGGHHIKIGGGIHVHGTRTKLSLLQQLEFHASPNAFYNSRHREEPARCYPGTRERVLEELCGCIDSGRRRSKRSEFVWVHGPAGVGKTAIMRSLCERLDRPGFATTSSPTPQPPPFRHSRLLSSFFFFSSDQTRNSSTTFVSTLAYQICCAFGQDLQNLVKDCVRKNPAIFSLGAEDQVRGLVVNPLQRLAESGSGLWGWSGTTRDQPLNLRQAIVIDGLDECKEGYERAQIIRVLEILAESFERHGLPLIIILSSRPHSDIRVLVEGAFHLIEEPADSEQDTRGREVGLYQDLEADKDVRRFYEEKFEQIAKSHPLRAHLQEHQAREDDPLQPNPPNPNVRKTRNPTRWPSLAVLDILVEKTSGQFIVAATIIRFLSALRSNPQHRLDIILASFKENSSGGKRRVGQRPSRGKSYVVPPSEHNPYEQLDALYRAIFGTVEAARLKETLGFLAVLYYQVQVQAATEGQEEGVEDPENVAAEDDQPASDSAVPPRGTRRQTTVMLGPISAGILLGGRPSYAQELLLPLEALVNVNVEEDRAEFYHKSLEDFLFDEKRSGPDLHIRQEDAEKLILVAYLKSDLLHNVHLGCVEDRVAKFMAGFVSNRPYDLRQLSEDDDFRSTLLSCMREITEAQSRPNPDFSRHLDFLPISCRHDAGRAHLVFLKRVEQMDLLAKTAPSSRLGLSSFNALGIWKVEGEAASRKRKRSSSDSEIVACNRTWDDGKGRFATARRLTSY